MRVSRGFWPKRSLPQSPPLFLAKNRGGDWGKTPKIAHFAKNGQGKGRRPLPFRPEGAKKGNFLPPYGEHFLKSAPPTGVKHPSLHPYFLAEGQKDAPTLG